MIAESRLEVLGVDGGFMRVDGGDSELIYLRQEFGYVS